MNNEQIAKLRAVTHRDIPTAFDYTFTIQEYPTYVIVDLVSGETVYGYYGPESFASDAPGERDLLLECIFDVEDPEDEYDLDAWVPIEGCTKMLICAGQIKTIRFVGEDAVDYDEDDEDSSWDSGAQRRG